MKRTILLDIDSEYIKAGFSGEERPRLIVPNIVGIRSNRHLDEIMKQHLLKDIKLDKDVYFGNEAIKNRFKLKLKRPIDFEFKIERELLSSILEDVVFNLLNVKGRQNYVICHPLLVPNQFIEGLAKIVFEKLNPAGLSMISEPYATLQETNRVTGLVVQLDTTTQVLPIWEGTCFEQHANIYEVSLIDLKEQLETLISSRNGVVLSEFDLEEVLKYCMVANSREHYLNLMNEKVENIQNFRKELTFDEKKIVLDLERFKAPEIYFDPVSVGLDLPSLPEFLDSIVDNFERNMRKDFYLSIVLGGRGCFQGIPERIDSELKKFVKFEVNIKSFHPNFSNIIQWIGASKLSSHPDFANFMVNSSEYFEEAVQVLQKIRFELRNIHLNVKDIKLLPVFEKKKLEETPELIKKLTQFLKQAITVDLNLLAESFGVFQEEMERFLQSLLKTGKLKGEFLENNEFKFWIITNPVEVEKIKNNLKITIQQSSEILHEHFKQRLKNLGEIKSLKTFRARADEFYKKLSESNEKMNLLIKKAPVPLSKEDIYEILKYWYIIYGDIKEKFGNAIPF